MKINRFLIGIILILSAFSANAQTAWTNIGNGYQTRVVSGVREYRIIMTSGYAPFEISAELATKLNLADSVTKYVTPTMLGTKVNKTTTVNGHALSGNVTVSKSDVGLGNVDNTTDLGKPISTATQTALNAKIATSQRGANNGVAPLDASGKVPAANLPSGSQVFKGTWNASTNSPTLADGTGTAGWTYTVTTAGSHDFGSGSITFVIGDDVVYNGTIWQKKPNGSQVTSVNGQTGAVVLDKEDLDLDEVDNTADLDKPVSTATTSAIAAAVSPKAATTYVDSQDALKVDKVSGKGLSTNDYTTTEKSKLAGIASGATANVGTVTSVGVSVPTGFAVSGSPVTTSGTMALSYASGYSLPTTTNQNNWNTAYSWGNHAGLYLPLTGGTLTGTGLIYSLSAPTAAGHLTNKSYVDAQDALKEPIVTSGTTLQYYRGDKNWATLNTTAVPEGTNEYFTDARSRSTLMTGFTAGANSTILATDNLMQALGKAQGQLNNKEASFTKNTAFNKNLGTTAGTVSEGNHTHTFASLTSKPTTLAGYGITDGGYTLPTATASVLGGVKVGTGLSITSSVLSNSAPNATHTGDVTGSGALTIANSAVTFAKMQNVATNTLVGRGATGTGALSSITLGTGLSLSTSGVLSNSAPNVVQTTVSGNAGTATTLQTARTIWGQSFNGAANVTGAMTGITTATGSGNASFARYLAGAGTALLPAFSFTADPNTGFWNSSADNIGLVTNGVTRFTIGTSSNVSTLPITAPSFTGALSGNATTATTLATARTINGVSFNGSANITIADATKEPTANKSTSTSLGASNTLFPTQNAVKTYVDNAVVAAGSSNIFTSTGTAYSNCSSFTAGEGSYTSIHGIVTVYGSISITSGSTGTAEVRLDVPITGPISRVLGFGVATFDGSYGVRIEKNGSSTSDVALKFTVSSGGQSGIINYSYQYVSYTL